MNPCFKTPKIGSIDALNKQFTTTPQSNQDNPNNKNPRLNLKSEEKNLKSNRNTLDRAKSSALEYEINDTHFLGAGLQSIPMGSGEVPSWRCFGGLLLGIDRSIGALLSSSIWINGATIEESEGDAANEANRIGSSLRWGKSPKPSFSL